MKILVTGIRGQLGYDVMKILKSRNIEALGVSSADMDITDRASVDRVMDGFGPDAAGSAFQQRLPSLLSAASRSVYVYVMKYLLFDLLMIAGMSDCFLIT